MSRRQNRRRASGATGLTIWGLGYLVIGAALATAIAWPVYETSRVIVIAVVSVVLASAIVLLSARFRLAVWAVILLGILGYVLAVVPLAVPGALASPSLLVAGLRDGISGITLGWKQLLTLDLPLGDYQAVLVPFFLVIYVGSLIAVSVIVRGGRVSVVAVPAVVLMSAFGIVFGSSNTSDSFAIGPIAVPAAREVALGAGVILISFLWLIGRNRLIRASALRAARASTGTVRQRGESIALALRRNSLAVIIVAIAITVGIIVTPLASTIETRHALRDDVDPLLVVQQQTSPLSDYRSWFTDDLFETQLFTVEGAGGSVDRIRLATLDSFDGQTFHVLGANDDESNRFNRLPRTEPTSSGATRLTITIGEGYQGIWVPVPNDLDAAPAFTGPRSAELSDSFYVSEDASTAIDVATTDDGKPGLRPGDSYTVYAAPATADGALGTESPGPSLLGDTAYPALEEWVKLQAAPRNGEGLIDLVESMRARGYLSHSLEESGSADWIAALENRASFAFQPSYSGHSQSRVEDLFTTLSVQQRVAGPEATDQTLVSAIGDDEQFATAAALLARSLGFESRIVLGVRLAADDPDLGVDPCDESCSGANVSAWIEARRPGGEWVTIDTTPQFVEAPATISTGIELPENPTVPVEAQGEVVDPPEVDRGNSDLISEPRSAEDDWLAALLPTIRVVGLASLSALLLVLPVLVLAFAKSSRRRWRRASRVPEVSIVGAWEELVDTYADNGMPVPRAASRREFALASARPTAVALATLVDRAVFAEHPPGRDVSEHSWQLLDEERAQLAAATGFKQRLIARLSPASFLRSYGSETRVGAVLSLFGRKEI